MKTLLVSVFTTAVLFALPVLSTGHDGMMGPGYGGMHGPGQGMPGGMGPGDCGMMPDCGERGGMGLGAVERLDLNPDQQSRLNKIKYDLRKQEWALQGKIIDAQANLHDLYAADRPDPKKIGAVYGAIFDVRRQMIEAKINAMNRARDILNKDQAAKIKQLQQSQPGCGMHEMMHGQ